MFEQKMSNEELIKRLNPPKGKIKMVLDTDAYNEVDDQFALAYALLSDNLDVQAVYAAPFSNDRASTPKVGMEKSYEEILHVMDCMKRSASGMVFRGSDRYLEDVARPVQSEATDDLIKRATNMPEGELLYVVAIGAITNIASAILLCPEIINKIVVIWLGGQPSYWPYQYEFNLGQDIPATRVVFDCGVPLVQLPCKGVTSHLITTKYELEARLAGKNQLCDTLIEIFKSYRQNGIGHGKEIWDIVAIAYLIEPEWVATNLIHSPILTDQFTFSVDQSRHFIRQAWQLDRNAIFSDLFEKLSYKE